MVFPFNAVGLSLPDCQVERLGSNHASTVVRVSRGSYAHLGPQLRRGRSTTLGKGRQSLRRAWHSHPTAVRDFDKFAEHELVVAVDGDDLLCLFEIMGFLQLILALLQLFIVLLCLRQMRHLMRLAVLRFSNQTQVLGVHLHATNKKEW